MSYTYSNSIKIRGEDGKALSQEETVALTKKRAHKNGFYYRTTNLSDGKVRLILRKK